MRSKNTVINLVIIFVCAIGANLEANIFKEQFQYRTIEYPSNGVSLGNGWNSFFEHKTMSKCVVFDIAKSGGQAATISTLRIEDKDSLRRELDISYDVTAKAKFLTGSISASKKMDFYKKTEVENHAISLLVKGKVVNGVSYIEPADISFDSNSKLNDNSIRLTPFAKKLLKDKKIEDFIEYCGDSFVSSIERGAEIFALYNFKTKSDLQNMRKSEKSSLSGSYMGFSGKGDFSKTASEEKKNYNGLESINYYHSAHMGLAIPYDEATIKSSLSYLGSASSLEESYPFRIHLMSYKSLPDYQSQIKDIGTGVNIFKEAYRLRLTGLVNRLDTIIKQDTETVTHPITNKPENNVHPYRLEQRGKKEGFYMLMQDRMMREIQNLEKENEECLSILSQDYKTNTISEKEQQCIQSDNKHYWDYFYRTQMPVHNDNYKKLRSSKIKYKEYLESVVKNIESKRNQYRIPTWGSKRVCSSCWLIGTCCSNKSVRVYRTCSDLPNNRECKNYTRKIKDGNNALDLLVKGYMKPLDADSRFQYWIDEPSRERRKYNQVNGYLTTEELSLLKKEIFCQYPDMNQTECPNIEKRLLAGERLYFTRDFNGTKLFNKQRQIQDALLNEINEAEKNMQTLASEILKQNGCIPEPLKIKIAKRKHISTNLMEPHMEIIKHLLEDSKANEGKCADFNKLVHNNSEYIKLAKGNAALSIAFNESLNDFEALKDYLKTNRIVENEFNAEEFVKNVLEYIDQSKKSREKIEFNFDNAMFAPDEKDIPVRLIPLIDIEEDFDLVIKSY